MSRRVSTDLVVTTTNAITTSNSAVISVARAKTLSIQSVVDVNVPAAAITAAAAVDVTANTLTAVAHGFTTGLKGQISTSGGLPAGLAAVTDYFVVVIDSDTYKLASSLVNATAAVPTVIDITTQGTGNHTFTPTALAGATLTLQKSNDYDAVTGVGTWDAVAAATAITVDADIWISEVDPTYKFARLSFTLTAGRLSASTRVIVKEDF